MKEKILLIEETLGMCGLMICFSKTQYRERHPDNLAVFNANLCTKQDGKLWYGDIDVTQSKNDLCNLAVTLNEDIYILHEMDGRFENENNPLLSKVVIVFNADGTYKLNDNLSQFFLHSNCSRIVNEKQG